MNLIEARTIVLNECAREKRIVIRNIIIISIITLAVLISIYVYALPFVLSAISKLGGEILADPNNGYYKWAIIVGLFLTALYPAISLYKVISRGKKSHMAFDKISAGENFNILGEQTRYLTVIPLYWLKLNLSPIHYVSISMNNKLFDLPVPELLSVKVKTALNGADQDQIAAHYQQLFGNTEIDPEVLKQEKVQLPSLASFQEFIKKEITSDLAPMEKGRKTSKNMIVIQFTLVFALIGSLIYITVFNPNVLNSSESILPLVAIVVGGSIILSVLLLLYMKFKGGKDLGDYTSFKKSVFSKIINFVNPSFEYIENGHIEYAHLLHSGLFVDRQYTITGGDQIIGYHNETPFQSCNLTVNYRPNLRNEKEPDDTVFAGNYFVARFNKSFQFPIYIHPKKGVFSNLKDNEIAQYLDGSKSKITLEDPEFEKQFSVYCDDEIIVRSVLTPSMMEKIKEINERSKGNFYIAINNKNIVLANNSGNTSMKLGNTSAILNTKIDEKLLNQLFEELLSDLGMIDTLKLNVNIWNK